MTTTSRPTPDACLREVERLHSFFVEWYTGQLKQEAFERMDGAIAPDFEMVTPDGEVLDREAVLGMVRDTRGAYAPGAFGIDIRNFAPVDLGDDRAVVRYEEWQTTPDGKTGRLSTALFHAAPEAPGEFSWVTVHETWLDGES